MKRLVVVSGYFNPIHIGHVELLKSAKMLGDKLLVIVNNDKQQLLKKGKVIMNEEDRIVVTKAIRYVDDIILAIDEDNTVVKTLEEIAKNNTKYEILFANGGDRRSNKVVPETAICENYGIKMRFDVGGIEKLDSSSRINIKTGEETALV